MVKSKTRNLLTTESRKILIWSLL